MNKLTYDLHAHTTASDGALTSVELVQRAIDNAVDVQAITDHDTIKGINQAIEFINENKLSIKLIKGVEISTLWNKLEIHIVGLNIDLQSPILNQLLQSQEKNRIERAKLIGAKLQKVGVPDAYEKTKAYAKGDIVSRSHFGHFLVDNHYAKDMKRAFKKYLGKGGYAYVAPIWISMEEAINVIHQASGQAVLAHPSRYGLVPNKVKKLISDFKLFGGDAIEVSQSRQTIEDRDLLAKYANDFQLLASQGSDFHNLQDYLDLGKTQPLPENVKPIWYNWS